MPLISAYDQDPSIDGRQSDRAIMIRSGVMRGMARAGLTFAAELTLSSGRRADLLGLSKAGHITIVEIKSSVTDFRTDEKWEEYKSFCDQFYFATHPDVPLDIFPDDEGLIVADAHGCEIVRDAQPLKLAAPIRKAITLQVARTSANRLHQIALHNREPGKVLANEFLAPDK